MRKVTKDGEKLNKAECRLAAELYQDYKILKFITELG
jgi:hypothetical protein